MHGIMVLWFLGLLDTRVSIFIIVFCKNTKNSQNYRNQQTTYFTTMVRLACRKPSSETRGSKILRDDAPSSNALTLSYRSDSGQRIEFSEAHFSAEERECLNCLRKVCSNKHLKVPDETIIRFAIFHGFNVKRASTAIVKKHDHPFLKLRLEEDLAKFMRNIKTVFPLPGLKSAIGSDVLYWRPSRYTPSSDQNRLLIENMCYVLNDMNKTIEQCRNGVLVIVNMDGYSMKNFHRDTQMKLTRITEGQIIPAHLVQILIVNPPTFFERLWKVVRPAFSALFSKRILIIKSSMIANFLMEGYEEYLPDEFISGKKNTSALVDEYVNSKLLEETQGDFCDGLLK